MAVMAIMQDVDKCMRCNGCVISCKRTWQMMGDPQADNKPHQKVAINQRVVIKPMKRVDNPPYMRYSCWHCPDPPCAKRCPWKAIAKDALNGAVYIDPVKCDPTKPDANGNTCGRVCQIDCGRGGYPKIGAGCTDPAYASPKAWKCTMCYGRAGLPLKAEYGFPLPSKTIIAGVPETANQPSCVYTCPAKAMFYDSRDNCIDFLNTGKGKAATDPEHLISVVGDGSVFWFSRKYMLISPKADPFMEDHISPMVGSLLSGPFAKAALVPTLVAGGLLALAARRAKIQEEEFAAGGEAR
jgi:Fe-S-cluster-containing dehydrogenase component